MIADIALTAGVLIGLFIAIYGLWSMIKSVFLYFRNRRDAGPLHAALERMGENVRVRNAKVAARDKGFVEQEPPF